MYVLSERTITTTAYCNIYFDFIIFLLSWKQYILGEN